VPGGVGSKKKVIQKLLAKKKKTLRFADNWTCQLFGKLESHYKIEGGGAQRGGGGEKTLTAGGFDLGGTELDRSQKEGGHHLFRYACVKLAQTPKNHQRGDFGMKAAAKRRGSVRKRGPTLINLGSSRRGEGEKRRGVNDPIRDKHGRDLKRFRG